MSELINDKALVAAAKVARDAAARALEARGVNNVEHLVAVAEPHVVLAACRWWDGQPDRRPGTLANAVREGHVPTPSWSTLDEQEEYGERIVEWLRQNFPQWNRDDGNRTHSAAIAAVIGLHHQHGKGRLTKREHGPAIRAAVKAWEAQWAT